MPNVVAFSVLRHMVQRPFTSRLIRAVATVNFYKGTLQPRNSLDVRGTNVDSIKFCDSKRPLHRSNNNSPL